MKCSTHCLFFYFPPPGCFSVQNVVPQPDGDSSKVKVKVRVNVHGIFTVSGASLIEKQKGEGGEEVQMDTEPPGAEWGEGRGPGEDLEAHSWPHFTSSILQRCDYPQHTFSIKLFSISFGQILF